MDRPRKPVRGRPKQSSDISLAGSRALDRHSSVPLYFQLGAVLKEKVDTGAWQPGDRFPTEREIAEEFDVSRTVIRRALDLLVGDGGIVRIRGSGAFVTPPRREVRVFGLVKALLDLPDDITLTVLTAREEPADSVLAKLLDIEQEPSPVAHVTAVLHSDGLPICLVDSFSLVRLAPWVLPTAQALHAGENPPKPEQLNLGRTRASIELTFFGGWGGPQVGVSAGDPAMLTTLVQFSAAQDGRPERPLEFAHINYRTDNAQLAIDLD
jgi:GntR family transcriptional regulator